MSPKSRTNGVTKMIKFTDKLSIWVIDILLSQPTVELRASTLVHFIKVAKASLQLLLSGTCISSDSFNSQPYIYPGTGGVVQLLCNGGYSYRVWHASHLSAEENKVIYHRKTERRQGIQK